MIYENYEIGDIVSVDIYKYPDGSEGNYHCFVIMLITDHEITAVPIEYFGFIISSNIQKSNDVNVNYPYNEPIIPNSTNGLFKKSHVKCDELVSLNPRNIIMKLGNVSSTQYEKFMELYEQSSKN